MTPPIKAAGASDKAGRWAKAQQFAEAARLFEQEALNGMDSDFADVFVTLAVHSGIAPADVICIARLGQYSMTANHDDAKRLLEKAEPGAKKHLERLLALKTKAGYQHTPASRADAQTAARAYVALLDAAKNTRPTG
ncbi:hypothetical protein [Galactobacter valiniphilus]|uniref:hypothetical protein n=1 Tax=Galactobacter valiniphilus TaxID=2676122 RepID=UPI003735328A